MDARFIASRLRTTGLHCTHNDSTSDARYTQNDSTSDSRYTQNDSASDSRYTQNDPPTGSRAIQNAYTILHQLSTVFIALLRLKVIFLYIYSLSRIITRNTVTFINVEWKYSTWSHRINVFAFTHPLRPRAKQPTTRFSIPVSTLH